MPTDAGNDIWRNMITVARTIQQEFYELLPDWNKYEIEDFQVLRQYIEYALGDKEKLVTNNEQIKYRDEIVSVIYDQIMNYGRESDGSIYCSVVYNVTYEISEQYNWISTRKINYVPIFKIRNHSKVSLYDNLEKKYNIQYIDNDGRLYKNWNDYLTSNKLFPCVMVVPKNGYYEADPELNITEKNSMVLLEIRLSPICSLNTKIVNHIDIVSSVLSFGALGIAALSRFTPIAPMVMLAGATATSFGGIWMLGRSVHNLIDRKSHKESISLTNRNALSSWIGVAGYTMGFAMTSGSLILSKVAQTGKSIGLATRAAYNTVVIGNISVNVAYIGFNGYCIVEKYREERKIDMLDVVSFIAHTMFFGNTILSTQFAHDLINNSYGKILQDYEAILRNKRHRKAYNKIKNNANSKAEIVRYVRRVQSRTEFFSSKSRKPNEPRGDKLSKSPRYSNKPRGNRPRVNKPRDAQSSGDKLSNSLLIDNKIEIKNSNEINHGINNNITENIYFAKGIIYIGNSSILDPREFINNFQATYDWSKVTYSFLCSIEVSLIPLTDKLLKLLVGYYKYYPSISCLNGIPEFKMLLYEMQYTYDAERILNNILFLSMRILVRCNRANTWEIDLIKIAYILWHYGKAHMTKQIQEMYREAESERLFSLFNFISCYFEILSTTFSSAFYTYLNNLDHNMMYKERLLISF